MDAATTLIETVRVRDGHAPLFYLHLRRLVASCKALGVPFPGAFEIPSGSPDRVQRLEVSRSGFRASERELGVTRPMTLITSSVRHPGYPHKVAARGAFEQASGLARDAGADDALLLTSGGKVAEATIWCLFWWEGDRLAAPALDLGILPGVSRMRIEEVTGPVTPMWVGREGLVGRSLLLSNAARGIVQVSTLDGVSVPADSRTEALQARFWP